MIPFSYSVRSLVRRPLTVIFTTVGLTLVVVVFAGTLMLSRGVREAFAKNGDPDNFLALRDGATSELTSVASRDQARLLMASEEIARDSSGQPLADPELVAIAALERTDGSGVGNVQIRGVGRLARVVRPSIKVVEGREPTPGTSEVMVGKGIVGRFAGCTLGNHLTFSRRDWQVVGVFSADGAAFESEIWADVDQVSDAFSRAGSFSEVVGKLRDRGALAQLSARVAADPTLSTLKIRSEPEFFDSQSSQLRLFVTVLGLFVAVIFAIAAALGAAITMYAQVAGRLREVGTLRAIGFRRRSVLWVFLRESVVLAIFGGLIGIGIASALSLVSFSTANQQTFTEVTFRFHFGAEVAIASFVFALIMGLLGGFLPALRAARLSIVGATRG